MTELRNVEADLARFRLRVMVVGVVVCLCFLLVVARLVVLQVVRHDDLRAQAESNRTAVVPVVPNRGQILDRNGIILANNYSAYTLEITPSRVPDLEQTIDALAQIVEITPRDRRRFKKLQEESRSFESLPIRTKLDDDEVARFVAQRYRFAGVEIKARLFRNYPYGELASHVIGYIGRINRAEKDKLDDSDDAANYRGTEYIGKLGVEQSFESQLHGITGVDSVETSAGGRAVRKLASSPSTPGDTVVLSIDIRLQKMIEDLFGDRRGALVAMDPKTGEVLALVSKPTFDPNLFVDGIDYESWQALNESIDKPLLNRALRGTYPPGSTYKPFMAPLGFGQITGIDIQGESRGLLPSKAWKAGYYKRADQQKWYAGETISLGIGQGYNAFTMLQLAQATAIVANNGVKHKPQIVIGTQEAVNRTRLPVAATPGQNLGLRPEHLAIIQRALAAVTTEGTSTRVFAGAPYASAGKTGTAQAVGIAAGAKYNASKMEERRRDHALYMAYAPVDDPKIAVAVIVENAGFGAASAAPIARRVFDYWLLGQYPSEEDIAATRLGQSGAPIGTPRQVAAMPWLGAAP